MSVSSAPAAVSTAGSSARRIAGHCVTAAYRQAPPDLIDAIPYASGAVCFVVSGAGLVGWGCHATITVTGADAAARIERWYFEQVSRLTVADEVGVPGSGPVCFVSLGFGPEDSSVAVIPQVTVGRAPEAGAVDGPADGTVDGPVDGPGATSFMTTIGQVPAPYPGEQPAPPVTGPGQVRYSDAALSTGDFTSAVAAAVSRIRAGEAEKVVLSHDLTAMTEFAVDERFLLARLAGRYPTCAIFAVDGLVGASPEMLIGRHGAHVTSRVLAGTAWPERAASSARAADANTVIPDADTGDGAAPASTAAANSADNPARNAADSSAASRADADAAHQVAAHLLTSVKDLAEHGFAVQSVADVLGPVTTQLDVPATPAALELANLTHLATDISGELTVVNGDVPSALHLAAALHPTAAVGGTPTEVACAMIAELEPTPRGRYAAPIGWFDARGDGQFAIALRCAHVSGTAVRMMAGCGIVADSDPEREAREAQIKMVPIRDALESEE